jgi:hypothetical protein
MSYPLTADVISQEAEAKLSHDRSSRGGNFDGGIRGSRQGTGGRIIHVTYHGIGKIDGKDIISGGETSKVRSVGK